MFKIISWTIADVFLHVLLSFLIIFRANYLASHQNNFFVLFFFCISWSCFFTCFHDAIITCHAITINPFCTTGAQKFAAFSR